MLILLGFAGLISAHRYLALHPTASLVILDRNVHVGGVWSQDRIYPGFYSQFAAGLAEYSDLKMQDPPKEDRIGDCFKAKCMSDYLQDFAERMVHEGKSLRDRLRRAEIVNITKDERKENGRWHLLCRDLTGHEDVRTLITHEGEAHVNIRMGQVNAKLFTAHKLIVATGEFSTPNVPNFPGQFKFDSPIIHSTNFGESKITSTPNIKHIAVLGAGKSSADMLYTCIKSLPPDTMVHWIIREDGTGPGFFAPMDLPSPYKNTIEAANTGAMGLLQPSIFLEEGWWVWFLHRTWLGIWLISWIFGKVDAEAKKRAGYFTRGKECQERGFNKLDFNPGIFWQNSPGGALHHKDFWDVISSRVNVHRASITSMSHHTLHLNDNTEIPCDALLLGTGWTSSLSFFSNKLKTELGLPHHPSLDPPAKKMKWDSFNSEAEKQLFENFPILANPPKHDLKKARTTPYRLYRGISPLQDPSRSIVFINFFLSGNMIMNAEVQAMWAVAYLSRSSDLQLPSIEEQEREIARQVVWSKRRYLSVGQLGNFAGFDAMAYTDVLLKDVGVEGPWRAKGTWGVRRPEDLGKAWKLFLAKQRI